MSKQELQSVIPYLVVKDTVKAIELYQRAFGAVQENLMRTPDGARVMHACIAIGNSKLFLTDECPEMKAYGPGEHGSNVSFYVHVEDVDHMQKQAVAAGLTEVMPPADMFWGDRMGALVDPFGYRWSLATHKQDLTVAEVAKNAAEFFKKQNRAA